MNSPFATLTVALLLTPFAPLPAAGAPGELILLRDFRLGDLNKVLDPSPSPGLRLEARSYSDHNACEWQVRLQVPADRESAIYENLKSADFVVRLPSDKVATLHWSKGSRSDTSGFQPRVETLDAGRVVSLESYGGRSSDGAMPYFNLAGDAGLSLDARDICCCALNLAELQPCRPERPAQQRRRAFLQGAGWEGRLLVQCSLV